MAVSVYKAAILLILLISAVTGFKNNKFIEDMINDVMIKTQRDQGCQLNATRSVIEWCTIPTGLNTTKLKDDFVSFPQNTKCALKMDNSPVVCKGCYETRWYETSCNNDPYVHRQKRSSYFFLRAILLSMAAALRDYLCKRLEQPRHGRKHCDEGSCTFSCNFGYELQGSQRVTCEPNAPIPTCKVKTCPELPVSEYTCPEGRNYQSVCRKTCKKGYRATVQSRVNGQQIYRFYKDFMPPVFDNCPAKPVTVEADPGLTSAVATYGPITATDNSGTVNLKLVKGLPSGSRFEEGVHVIVFDAADGDGNVEKCTFIVKVIVFRCDVPDYNDTYMNIECPTGFLLGSQCSIDCRFGLPLVGPSNITCERDDSDPPKPFWDFSPDTRPFCKKSHCKNLTAPLNGALVCDTWAFGAFCDVTCNSNFDIPRGLYTESWICEIKTGIWFPTDRIPDCTEARGPSRIALPSELYYFDGDCTTSTDVIKNNFIEAFNNLTSWVYADLMDCTAENVVVKCGPTSGRRKRTVQSHRYKRAVNELLITFKIVIPFSVNGTSKADARDISVAKLKSIADNIKRDVVNGVFSSVAPGFTIKNDSVNFGFEDFECPEGQIPNNASVSCRGCPTGTMYNRTAKDCTFCKKGTYQDEAFSMSCKSCPENTSTIDDGSRIASNCLAICGIGESSPTGLMPCSPCQIGSYQDTENSQTCKKCPADTSSSKGSTSLTDCKGFDVVLTGPIKLTSKPLESDMDNFTLSVWFKYKSLNTNFTISLIKEERSLIVVDFANDITVNMNGVALTSLPRNSEWTNIVLTWLNLNKSLKVYFSGQLVSTKTVSSLESNLLDNASMEIELTEGNEMTVRQVQLSDILLDDATIENSSRTCELTTSPPLISLSSFRPDNRSKLSIVMPSTCDDINSTSEPEGTTATITTRPSQDFTTTRQTPHDESDEEDNDHYTLIIAVSSVVACVVIVTICVCIACYVSKKNRKETWYSHLLFL